MYNIKNLIYIAILTLVSCNDIKQKPVKYIIPKQPKQAQEKPYANPSLFMGSSFAIAFQSFYRLNNYPLMLAFTSERTLNRFGRANVLAYYQHRYTLDYKLGQLTNITYIGDTILLTYAKANIFATRRKIVIPCILERDSIRILLNNLSKNPFE